MSTTIKKRHREQTRHERQQNKDARRAQRKTEKSVSAPRTARKTPTWQAWSPALNIPAMQPTPERSIPPLQDKWLFQ